jgi:hypothetical protein
MIPDDEPYVGTLIKNMTLKEQAAIASEPFETLVEAAVGRRPDICRLQPEP